MMAQQNTWLAGHLPGNRCDGGIGRVALAYAAFGWLARIACAARHLSLCCWRAEAISPQGDNA
ncbi:hypothetical protein J2046_002728 [Rhizobium petrolearium]|uniref:hypothetical protein n=1 Tax=Neorhizobium petrolearium TaxID=515361 RepID=UPI001AEA0964|nr:hypothetical protein [Neorhizobium petrolearium]MBP1844469.1 hypothetical protein [Neorhizobium petrolearium]